MYFYNTDWEIQLGGETKLMGGSINGGVPTPATIAYPMGRNFFIVAAIDGSYLKMVKILVTGESSFDWIEAKYVREDSADSSCLSQSTFTEECYQGSANSYPAYNVQLMAVLEPGMK